MMINHLKAKIHTSMWMISAIGTSMPRHANMQTKANVNTSKFDWKWDIKVQISSPTGISSFASKLYPSTQLTK